MKKSKLLALSLASLVGLVSCGGGSNPPKATPFEKTVEEKFVEAVFGAEEVANIGEVVVTDPEKDDGVEVFEGYYGTVMDHYFGGSVFSGYEYVTILCTLEEEEDFYTAKEFFSDVFGEEVVPVPNEPTREGEDPEPEPEPSEPAPIKAFYDYLMSCGKDFESMFVSGISWDDDYEQGDGIIAFYEYGREQIVTKMTFFGLCCYDNKYEKSAFIEAQVAAGMDEEEALAAWGEFTAGYKLDDNGDLPFIYFASGASVISERGDKWLASEVATYMNEQFVAEGVQTSSDGVFYYSAQDMWVMYNVGDDAAEGWNTEENLVAFVEQYAAFLPGDFSLTKGTYYDAEDPDFEPSFLSGSYYYAVYSASDDSVSAAFMAGIDEGKQYIQMMMA